MGSIFPKSVRYARSVSTFSGVHLIEVWLHKNREKVCNLLGDRLQILHGYVKVEVVQDSLKRVWVGEASGEDLSNVRMAVALGSWLVRERASNLKQRQSESARKA